MRESNSGSLTKDRSLHYSWPVLLAPVVAAPVLVFVLARTVHLTWTVGDSAIWIPLHEWVSRGATLYEGVWEHKDWGFIWLFQPLYSLLGIPGLYLMALLFTSTFGIGIYLLIRPLTTPIRAFHLSLYALVLYVASPVYWSIHPENAAICLAVLATGLLFRFPLAAGVFFTLSMSVKLSGVLLLVSVVGAVLLLDYSRTRRIPSALNRQRLLRLGFGLVSGGIVILVAAALSGSIFGWLEVIDYNGEYARWRGFPPDVAARAIPMTVIQRGLSDASDLPLGIFAQLITLPLVAIALLFLWRRQVKAGALSSLGILSNQQLSVVIGLLAGALLTTVAQRPSIQHWQYVIGPLVALVAVSAAAAINIRKLEFRRSTIVLIAVLLVPVLSAANHDGNLLPNRVIPGVAAWFELGEGAVLSSELSSLPPDSSFVFLGTNEHLVDIQSLPAGSTLACRFFFQFQWHLPRYGEDILDCLTSGSADYVITDSSDHWGDEGFRPIAYESLRANYRPCIEAPTHVIWCRATVE